jgi:hypothetical protein
MRDPGGKYRPPPVWSTTSMMRANILCVPEDVKPAMVPQQALGTAAYYMHSKHGGDICKSIWVRLW